MQRGLTLVEVLIAASILAGSALAVIEVAHLLKKGHEGSMVLAQTYREADAIANRLNLGVAPIYIAANYTGWELGQEPCQPGEGITIWKINHLKSGFSFHSWSPNPCT